MKTNYFAILLAGLMGCSAGNSGLDGESQFEPFAPDGIPFVVSDSLWKADGQGNHRAVVEVSGKKVDAVEVFLPWRRPDLRADRKKVVVVDAASGKTINNVFVKDFSAESVKVCFEPVEGSERYFIYYLPYKYRKGWNDARYGKPWNDYLAPVYKYDKAWKNGLSDELPEAKVLRFESRSRFDAFTSMGLTATAAEMDSLKKVFPVNPVLFPEDRAFPIRLTNQLPVRWVMNGKADAVKGHALRGEYYVWQIGVWAAHEALDSVRLQFSDLKSSDGVIPAANITCFNQEGVDWDGAPVLFNVKVPKGKVQALWCGVQIPQDAIAGVYKGELSLSAVNGTTQVLPVEIRVEKGMLADHGDNDLWRHSRLRWLNSTIGQSDEPVKPYAEMLVDGQVVQASDKTVKLGANGFPESIVINEKEVLAQPLRFVVATSQGEVAFEADGPLTPKRKAGGLVTWQTESTRNGIHMLCKARMEYDGFIHYELAVSSDKAIKVNDIRLETYYTPYASKYFMGTGFSGGNCPNSYEWNWKGPWDSYWIGDAKAGLHVEFRGGSYHGPLLKDYKPEPPAAWSNKGKGSVRLHKAVGTGAQLVAATGVNTLSSTPRIYAFDLMITPVKPINPSKHFSERYFHADPKDFDQAAEEGANIANIHHARDLNPVINYPFIVQDSLKQFIAHEHDEGRKVKLYYTIRELTNYATEIYALKSLNHEILSAGVGYGLPWHCEHLIDDYRPAWYSELPDERADAALVMNGFSRWINYYLEGLRWMFENYELDGIYMDDVAFDRPVMKRMRSIIDEYRPEALIDLHSNTEYSIGPANQYTGFFPYVDRLWFGEHFWYNKMRPDEWLVTFSGIPFGQMSEMLQDGGNRFLGMVYGATARHSYGQFSPVPVWNLWKSFDITAATMLGYWDEQCPVSTSDAEVKATAYVKSDEVLIAIGNFADVNKSIRLSFDWKALGMDPSTALLEAPEVKDFQCSTTFAVNDPIPVKSKEGWLLVLKKK